MKKVSRKAAKNAKEFLGWRPTMWPLHTDSPPLTSCSQRVFLCVPCVFACHFSTKSWHPFRKYYPQNTPIVRKFVIPMKTLATITLVGLSYISQAQSVVGTWQLTEEKTCFQSQSQSQFAQSDTEKELSAGMGSTSKRSVAKLITFTSKGKGEEGVFSKGKKKGETSDFRYQVKGGEIQFLDRKSGMITSRFVIEELSGSVLRFHDAERDCEVKAFTRVK
jgi:hypothetical protein